MANLPPRAGYVHDGPFDSGMLPVSSIHKLYYAQYGRTDGLPVVFLHGGPGGRTSPANTQYFNPKVYRVMLFDQRGAGKSLPPGETTENTAQHLVFDIERLREHLGISQWAMVFGGSWGALLGLLYTQTHPERVRSLVLRGVFTGRKAELTFSRGPDGTAWLFPDKYEALLDFLPIEERDDPYPAYHRRVMSSDRSIALSAATAWNQWGTAVGSICPGPEAFEALEDEQYNLVHAKLECHYFENGMFVAEGQLLDPSNMAKMSHIPGAIVHGRYDILTPPKTAWEVHKLWPKSSLHFIDVAGHSASEPGTASKLTEVCDEFARIL